MLRLVVLHICKNENVRKPGKRHEGQEKAPLCNKEL